MPRTATLAALMARIRERCEVSANYVTDSVLTDWINESIVELYGIVTDLSRDWYMCATPSAITVVAGTTDYNLPTDFYKAVGVDLSSGGKWVNVPKFMWSQRNLVQYAGTCVRNTAYLVRGGKLRLNPSPVSAASMRLWYVPVPTKLSTNTDTFDGILGWDEYVVSDVCAKCAEKEESDPGSFLARKAATLAIITREATCIDESEPSTVRDIDSEMTYSPSYWNP